MFKKFKNIINRERHHHCGSCEFRKSHKIIPPCADELISINDAPEQKRVIVAANSDIKTMEMGLYPGSIISLTHNNPQERNIIVKIHDQRYVIPREIAKNIMVKSQ
jgi:Fe2+ transport system protein FeoA